ncbi:mannan endo-1,4-beta-mannosidase 2-like [Chlorella sorokiniana]|uniref:mannan endo-1,4-beta-mannosidase n=1 Tax=Chlorella sorokiniana TaxID=3076 RepID=A0A2P6TR95_CHLSO|nr:mannan endo-1,4-beta-mannosidase 2-like [Chlorella sorokiniana]|eukprot:PRW56573.1 mannan endo-1,4-beta-mannosidase 2-like [Chlorella sorokiniana]
MQALVTRRAKAPSGSSDEGGSPRAGDSDALLHKGGASSAPALGAAPAAPAAGGAAASRSRRLHWALYLLALLAGLGLLLSAVDRPDYTHKSFVKVQGTQLMVDCRPFYAAGFNLENVLLAPMAKMARKLAGEEGGVAMIAPGKYDEDVFRGLDVVIAEAERAGLRVILSFVDNWKYLGGVDEYVDWSDTAPARDKRYPPINKLGDVSTEDFSKERLEYENKRKVLFYTDPGCKRLYKDHVRAVLERRNTASGKLYRDDPAIMAFNLINEPRCSAYETPECTDLFQKWVLDMATHFKSLDQQHLLTVGSEGFWGERDAFKDVNPGASSSDWAAKSGQDFVANNNLPMIDFAAVHLWPTNWGVAHNHTFTRLWIESHVKDCQEMLKKPCLLEEFGHALGDRGLDPPPEAIASERDPHYRAVLDAVEYAIGRGHALSGSLFWRWGLRIYRNDVPGIYGVLPTHSTFKMMAEHAQRVRVHTLAHPSAAECPLDCWVGVQFGPLRRCEHRPSVCAEQRARAAYQKSYDGDSPRLLSHGQPVWTSQAECCRPGLGAFERGCSTTLF